MDDAPGKTNHSEIMVADTAIVNGVTGSGDQIPEPVHAPDLDDKLDAAFASAEPDWWFFLDPAQPN
jgi:hypothetical protein